MSLDERGLVHVRAIGFWEPAAVEPYFAVLVPLMVEARRRVGRAMVLVDKRETFANQTS